MKRAWSSLSSLFQQSQICANGGEPVAANQTIDLAGLTLQIEPSVPQRKGSNRHAPPPEQRIHH